MKNKKSRVKVSKLFIIAFLSCFLFAIIKLVYVAVAPRVDNVNLTEFANNRNNIKKTLYASRGRIYDVNGEALAQDANSYTLIAFLASSRTKDPSNPQHVVDKESTAKALSEVLNMDYEYALKRLNVKNAYQVEFGIAGKDLSENKKKEIESLNLAGIGFSKNAKKRYYPKSKAASYIIGYAKRKSDGEDGEIVGEMGIESYYNEILKGTNGVTEYQRDAYGYQMGEAYYTKEPVSGSDIYLTIDSQIQLILEDAVKSLDETNDFEWFTINVMDAKTGAIVGSAFGPSFDPNNLSTITRYINPLVSYTYEPGSTMKIFSFLAAMENGIYDGNAKYASGSIKVKGGTIYDFNRKGWGSINYDTGFKYSSNVAASNLALELGNSKLIDFYKNLGFGKKTGIELSGEESGSIVMQGEIGLANGSFGQALTTTPIQTLQALSILTNNGVELKPYIVSKIVDQNGNVTYEGKRTELGQKVSNESVKKMNELMYGVVYDGLTKAWQPNNVTMSGKTGTAQIAGAHGYLHGDYDYIRSFAGVFPYENPEYIIYASVKKLNSNNANNLAKVVKTTVENIANYANITSTTTELDMTKIITIEDYRSSDTSEVVDVLTNKNIVPIVIGNGDKIVSQFPEKDSKVLAGSKVFLITNSTDYIMPDMKGWNSSEAFTFCKLIGLKYDYSGYGKVESVSIAAGSKLDLTKSLEIILSSA